MKTKKFIKKVESLLKKHANLKMLESYSAAEYHLILLKNETAPDLQEELKELIKYDLYLCNIII